MPDTSTANGQQQQKHPLLESLRRELGVSRIAPEVVIVGGKRWLLRPLTFDDQHWVLNKQNDMGPTIVYAAQPAISIAAIGEVLTKTVKTARQVMEDGKVKLGEDGKPIEVEFEEEVPLPEAEQPPMTAALQLFPPVFPANVTLAVTMGMAKAPEFVGDPLDPPNPWRELVAEQVMLFLRQMAWSVSRDLFERATEIQARVEVPQLPLRQPSAKVTTT